MQIHIAFSEHAISRMAQRNLSEDDVAYVISHGMRYRCAGVVHYFLGRKNIPKSDARDSAKMRLEGVTVLTVSRMHREDAPEVVVTVYRDRSASRKIRQKTKYNMKKLGHYGNLPLAG